MNNRTSPTMPTAAELAGVGWRISTRSGNGSGNCVEVGQFPDGSGRVAVRHSHQPDNAVIVYTRTEWTAFVAGVKGGEFDFE